MRKKVKEVIKQAKKRKEWIKIDKELFYQIFEDKENKIIVVLNKKMKRYDKHTRDDYYRKFRKNKK